jgi:hypothetical protein
LAPSVFIRGLVVATSYLRLRLGHHIRKSLEVSFYPSAAALFCHGLFSDPRLKHSPVAWADGGKLLFESCLHFIAVVSLFRLRQARRKARHLRQAAMPRAISQSTLKKALFAGESLLI